MVNTLLSIFRNSIENCFIDYFVYLFDYLQVVHRHQGILRPRLAQEIPES